MANYSATFDTIATGTSEKTLLEIATPSTTAAAVFHWWIDFHGVSSSATPILVKVVRATASITGTGLTPVRISALGPSTALVTAKRSASGGSGSDLGGIAEYRRVSPTTGFDSWLPDNRLIEMDESTWLRLNVTAAADVNATVGFAWAE